MTRRIMRMMPALAIAALMWTAGAAAADETWVRTDAQLAGELGLLLGEGDGLTDAYLGKTATRLQAAILFLRLSGLEEEAFAYDGADNFSDAGLVNERNRRALAYLKANPGLGWAGVGGNRFDPLGEITAQQFYKVVLETLGYRTGMDFDYADTLRFAASLGLGKAASAEPFRNADIAAALVEALRAEVAGGGSSFAETLAARGAIDASLAEIAAGQRIDVAFHEERGGYLTDGEGRTLYYFASDAGDLNACRDNCLVNWPVFRAERLIVANGLDPADFGEFTREDGTGQLTYKGWPLYYFVRDEAPGDTNGHGINNVWFVVNPETLEPLQAHRHEPEPEQEPVQKQEPAPEPLSYTIDIRNFSFGPPLTVKAGSSITFVNHDDVQHNAVAVSGAFATPLLGKGESYTITLHEPGEYDYFCEPHKPFMIGKIIVE